MRSLFLFDTYITALYLLIAPSMEIASSCGILLDRIQLKEV